MKAKLFVVAAAVFGGLSPVNAQETIVVQVNGHDYKVPCAPPSRSPYGPGTGHTVQSSKAEHEHLIDEWNQAMDEWTALNPTSTALPGRGKLPHINEPYNGLFPERLRGPMYNGTLTTPEGNPITDHMTPGQVMCYKRMSDTYKKLTEAMKAAIDECRTGLVFPTNPDGTAAPGPPVQISEPTSGPRLNAEWGEDIFTVDGGHGLGPANGSEWYARHLYDRRAEYMSCMDDLLMGWCGKMYEMGPAGGWDGKGEESGFSPDDDIDDPCSHCYEQLPLPGTPMWNPFWGTEPPRETGQHPDANRRQDPYIKPGKSWMDDPWEGIAVPPVGHSGVQLDIETRLR